VEYDPGVFAGPTKRRSIERPLKVVRSEMSDKSYGSRHQAKVREFWAFWSRTAFLSSARTLLGRRAERGTQGRRPGGFCSRLG
jgi:hypothetical protein